MEPTRFLHYEIVRPLGRGGMGEVYEALDRKLERRVALKFIAPELAADEESLGRFRREALNAAQINHPNIATIYAFEEDAGRQFIAMEFVAGGHLKSRIDGGALPVDAALAIARDVAAALAAAHRRNIVHRDIKPENLMFSEDGVLKVMDFGLARATLATRITVSGSQLGTPAYMSPEALAGDAGPPADVWALGLVLHEMLTGRRVFDGDNMLSVMYRIANEEPPALGAARDDLPPEIAALAARMLVRDPAARIDAAGAARELAALTGSAVPALESSGVAPAWTGGPPSAAGPRSQADTVVIAPARRFPARAVATIAGVVLAAGGALGFLQWQGAGKKDDAQAVAFNNQASEALDRGDLAAAQTLFTQALDRNPNYGPALLNLGMVLKQKQQPDSAAAVLGRVLTASDRDPALQARAYYELGDLDLEAGSWDSAIANYAKSFALDTTEARAYNNYALALTGAGRAPEALVLLERGMSAFPTVAPLWKNAGVAALQLKRDEEALRYLTRAVELDALLAAAHGWRAAALARSSDKAGAAAEWGRYVALSPDPKERATIAAELSQSGVATGP